MLPQRVEARIDHPLSVLKLSFATYIGFRPRACWTGQSVVEGYHSCHEEMQKAGSTPLPRVQENRNRGEAIPQRAAVCCLRQEQNSDLKRAEKPRELQKHAK